jgi:adenylyltransferase/sulfurtransferase
MNDEQLLRYSRHILFDPIGIEGQTRIMNARVLIVGAGGLGSPAALYLASAGVGRMTLADGDTVDLTNLQRQILHTQDRVGQAKALSGQVALMRINPEVAVVPVIERLAGERLAALVAEADVVLDCCDNFDTRYTVNRACVSHHIPWVSGAAVCFSGQISVFDPRRADSPCYHCLFPEGGGAEETRCAVAGIFASLTGIIGAMQAAEALKLISGAGESLTGRLLLLDGLTMEWRSVRFGKDTRCVVCAGAT